MKYIMPLLRQSLVLINPAKVEAIEITEEHGEKVIRVFMEHCEVKIKSTYAEVLPPAMYIEMG